jgi:putative ABC transport system permease protein
VIRLVREAFSSALSQPVASLTTIAIVAGMCLTVLLTSGKTAGAEEAVVQTFDTAGTRSIVIQASPDAGLTSSVVERLSSIGGIEWVGAFGPATDVRTGAIPGSTKVPLRAVYSHQLEYINIAKVSAAPELAIGSRQSLEKLRLPDGVGFVTDAATGRDYSVVGEFAPPEFLSFLEPLLLSPVAIDGDQPVAAVVIVAARPDLVQSVSVAAQSVIAADDPTKISITTSEKLASLRTIVKEQLGGFGYSLVVLIFVLTGFLVGTVLYALVMLRRRDFGRRRALGASRGLITGLLLIQTTLLSTCGAIAGSVAAFAIQLANTEPMPSLSYFVATALLSCAAATTAAIVPALIASTRDPLKELRVP